MKKHFFKRLPDRHILMARKICQQFGQSLLNSCFQGHTLDLHIRLTHRDAMAEADHVLVRISHMNFSHSPWLILWTENHFGPKLCDSVVIIVNIIHENREPHSRLPLLALTKENFNSTKLNCAKRRRISPIPKLSEQQFFSIIIHRLRKIANVKDWRQALG